MCQLANFQHVLKTCQQSRREIKRSERSERRFLSLLVTPPHSNGAGLLRTTKRSTSHGEVPSEYLKEKWGEIWNYKWNEQAKERIEACVFPTIKFWPCSSCTQQNIIHHAEAHCCIKVKNEISLSRAIISEQQRRCNYLYLGSDAP